MLHFILNGETDLQKQFNLNPAFWSGKSTESQIQQLMEYFLNDCLTNFREYRFHYLSEMLNQVRSEDDTDEERVDILVKSAHRICSDACFNKKMTLAKDNAIRVAPQLSVLMEMLTPGRKNKQVAKAKNILTWETN